MLRRSFILEASNTLVIKTLFDLFYTSREILSYFFLYLIAYCNFPEIVGTPKVAGTGPMRTDRCAIYIARNVIMSRFYETNDAFVETLEEI